MWCSRPVWAGRIKYYLLNFFQMLNDDGWLKGSSQPLSPSCELRWLAATVIRNRFSLYIDLIHCFFVYSDLVLVIWWQSSSRIVARSPPHRLRSEIQRIKWLKRSGYWRERNRKIHFSNWQSVVRKYNDDDDYDITSTIIMIVKMIASKIK